MALAEVGRPRSYSCIQRALHCCAYMKHGGPGVLTKRSQGVKCEKWEMSRKAAPPKWRLSLISHPGVYFSPAMLMKAVNVGAHHALMASNHVYGNGAAGMTSKVAGMACHRVARIFYFYSCEIAQNNGD